MIFTSFFRNPLLYNTTCFKDLVFFSTTSLKAQPPQFYQSKQSFSRSMTGDQIGDALSCLSINWKVQDMQLLFGLDINKIYNKSTWWLQLTSCRLLLETFTHTNIHNFLLPASIYHLSFFFFFPLTVILRISICDEWLSNFENVDLVSFIWGHIQHLCLYKLWEIREHSVILYLIEFVQDLPTGGKK